MNRVGDTSATRQNLAAHYEQLRRDAMSRPAHSGAAFGLALFLHRGMTAWMQAWSECADVETETCSTSGGQEAIPVDMRSQLTTLLVGMILSLRQEATP